MDLLILLSVVGTWVYMNYFKRKVIHEIKISKEVILTRITNINIEHNSNFNVLSQEIDESVESVHKLNDDAFVAIEGKIKETMKEEIAKLAFTPIQYGIEVRNK